MYTQIKNLENKLAKAKAQVKTITNNLKQAKVNYAKNKARTKAKVKTQNNLQKKSKSKIQSNSPKSTSQDKHVNNSRHQSVNKSQSNSAKSKVKRMPESKRDNISNPMREGLLRYLEPRMLNNNDATNNKYQKYLKIAINYSNQKSIFWQSTIDFTGKGFDSDDQIKYNQIKIRIYVAYTKNNHFIIVCPMGRFIKNNHIKETDVRKYLPKFNKISNPSSKLTISENGNIMTKVSAKDNKFYKMIAYIINFNAYVQHEVNYMPHNN